MLSKIFKAYDVRGIYPDDLNEELARKIGYASGRFLRQSLEGQAASDPMLEHVVVGRDMRKHSPKLAKALIEGLRAVPVHVIDLGMVDTSFIYFAVNHLGCAGGIMVTASHNPPKYNGFKISGRHALPIGANSGLEDIQRFTATYDTNQDAEQPGNLEQRDLWAAYREHVHQFLTLDRPLKVAIDASNGMAGEMVPRVFEAIKNLEIITVNFEITGEFVHEPNPLVAENMAMTQEAVKKSGADLGVCFDGDADRCMITDEQGNIVGCDMIGGVMAEHFLKAAPGSPIVFDLRSSKALGEKVEACGGKPVLSRVGHVFMKAALRENDAVFGAELSGHMYYRDNFFTDSGAITFAVILSILASGKKTMSGLIAPMQKYHQSGEINFQVTDKDSTLKQMKKRYAEHEIFELDGVTIDAFANEGWWFNVRASNTEPLLRLNMEARDAELLQQKYDEVSEMLGEPVTDH